MHVTTTAYTSHVAKLFKDLANLEVEHKSHRGAEKGSQLQEVHAQYQIPPESSHFACHYKHVQPAVPKIVF